MTGTNRIRGRGFTHEATTAGSVEWLTPRAVFDALDCDFDLDPCSPGEGRSHVPARAHYTITDDGLAKPWFGRVWLNPPYGRGIDQWLRRAHEHARTGFGSVIALVPNRTDTAWFQRWAPRTSAMLLHAGRIRFHRGDKNSPQTGSPGTGSILLAYGSDAHKILTDSDLPGIRVATII